MIEISLTVMIMSPMHASASPTPDIAVFNGAVLLDQTGVISAQGADAATFLHGQLSQDMNSLTAKEARLAAFCSAKGRMQASFTVVRPDSETFWLLTDAGVLPAIAKRLSMFVLRSKVKVLDARADLAVVGLLGAAAQTACEAATVSTTPMASALHASGQGVLIRLSDAYGVQRALWVGPRSALEAVMQGLPAVSANQWAWLEVMSGVIRIEPATVEQFVPQMVNYELVGGVNFKKGCYPGQEVVARSQYRGTLKRRTYLCHADAPMQAGQEVFSAADPTQPGGMVVNAAPSPDASGTYSALVELKIQALDTPWHVGAAEGPALRLAELPYALPSAEDNA